MALTKSGRPGSNRRRPAWEAFWALAGQGFFGGGSRNGITQSGCAPQNLTNPPSVKRRVRGVAITRAPRPGPRQAHLEGFDLHGNVAVAADNREALEQLCRYVLRPPIAQECLSRTADRSQASHRHSEGVSIHRHAASEEVAADSEKPRKSSRYGATGGVVDALRTISGRIPLYGSYLLSVSLVVDTLADGGLPHNRHKPRLAGYELGGSE